MNSIYAPWRHSYVFDGKDKGGKSCVFCTKIKEVPSSQNLVLKTSKHFALMLNKYPYSQGHLMVIPVRHIASVQELKSHEFYQKRLIFNFAINILKKAFPVKDFNIGYNLGSAGGAGIPKHLHKHIVPRYQNDQSYDPWRLGDNSLDLERDYCMLKTHFESEPENNPFEIDNE